MSTKPLTQIMSNFIIDTDKFFNSHNKKPSGKGFWMFEVKFAGRTIERTFNGSFSEAKKDLKLQFKDAAKTEFVTVTVLP